MSFRRHPGGPDPLSFAPTARNSLPVLTRHGRRLWQPNALNLLGDQRNVMHRPSFAPPSASVSTRIGRPRPLERPIRRSTAGSSNAGTSYSKDRNSSGRPCSPRGYRQARPTVSDRNGDGFGIRRRYNLTKVAERLCGQPGSRDGAAASDRQAPSSILAVGVRGSLVGRDPVHVVMERFAHGTGAPARVCENTGKVIDAPHAGREMRVLVDVADP